MVAKLTELAKKQSEGQDKFYNRIRNVGLIWNHKRVVRVYKMMGLNKRKKTRKRLPARVQKPLVIPEQPNVHEKLIYSS